MSINVTAKVSKNNIPNVIAAIAAQADNCVKGCAEGIKEKAQGLAPVRTGALKAGIQVSGGGNTYQVTASSTAGGAGREYAVYNEYGTRNMGAQPFMKPGFEAAMASDVPQEIMQYAAAIEKAA